MCRERRDGKGGERDGRESSSIKKESHGKDTAIVHHEEEGDGDDEAERR